MALEQGELAVKVNSNGTVTIGSGHTISGDSVENLLKSASDAYGKRLGTVTYADGSTQVLNEYKTNPTKEVDPAVLRDVPTMHVEWKVDADGNKVIGANGKPIVETFGVKYADGTISYTGAGRDGVIAAENMRSQAKMYNDFVTDARTREDFNTDQQYQDFITNKNIRIGQGSYVQVNDKQGNSKLVAPNGATIAQGSVEEVRNAYRNESNKLNLAMASAERVQSFTANEKRYVMETQGLATDVDFNTFVRNDMKKSQDLLTNIYNSWSTAAQEQGIATEGKMWYQPTLPDLNTFVPNVIESTISYDEWYNQNIKGIQTGATAQTQTEEALPTGQEGVVEQTITGTEGGTEDVTGTPTAVGNTGTTTPGGGFYQPYVQTPTATTTTTSGYQNVAGVYPTTGTSTTGTTTVPSTTAGLSALPTTTTTYPNYTGTTMSNLTSQSQQGYGGQVMYKNPQTGQMLYVTIDASGKPMTYVPPGFVPASSIVTMQDTTYTASGDIASQGYNFQNTSYNTDGTANLPQSYLDAINGRTDLTQEQKQQMISEAQTAANKTGAAKGGLMRMAEGGQTQDRMLEAKYRIATMNGYNGPKTNSALDAFANASPAMTAKFRAIGVAVAKGGYIKGFAPGGDVGTATTSIEDFNAMQQGLITQTMQPIQSGISMIQPESADFIGDTAGQTVAQAPTQEAATVANVSQVGIPLTSPTSVMTPATVSPQVQTTTEGLTAATGTLGTQAQVTAEQQLTTSVSGMESAQGTAIKVDSPEARKLQTDPITGESEIISGVANAQTAANFNEAIQAAEATPTKQATVQGQLEGLMQQFEGGNTPAWAAGSMRNAMATLAARGLGASSMAGQAVIQAAMEAALPIAQMDAQTQAQFESQNLSNRQQRAMLAAQQRAQFLGMEFDQAFQARVQNAARIGDIANMNFTAEQQIALEDSRALNTMELNNLSNRQAMVLAEAAALSQLDMANLSNRQQAAVQNAQNFLQIDMANLSNAQQTALFKAQQNIQALFTDQAAENAAAQFNASSENQTNQFFASLSSQVGQFNASQQNAMDQFNVNSVNALRQFNSEIQQQRDLFNAQNGLVVAQANAQWRQNIATLNQAAQNESNMDFAKTINALTSTNLDQIWQRERDIMSFAFTAQQSALDRSLNLLLGDKKIAEVEKQLSAQKDAASTELAFRFLFGSDPAIFGGIFNK